MTVTYHHKPNIRHTWHRPSLFQRLSQTRRHHLQSLLSIRRKSNRRSFFPNDRTRVEDFDFPLGMFALRVSSRLARPFASRLASTQSTLLLLEQADGKLESSSLSALTAASQLGGSVTALVVGEGGTVDTAVEQARK